MAGAPGCSHHVMYMGKETPECLSCEGPRRGTPPIFLPIACLSHAAPFLAGQLRVCLSPPVSMIIDLCYQACIPDIGVQPSMHFWASLPRVKSNHKV